MYQILARRVRSTSDEEGHNPCTLAPWRRSEEMNLRRNVQGGGKPWGSSIFPKVRANLVTEVSERMLVRAALHPEPPSDVSYYYLTIDKR